MPEFVLTDASRDLHVEPFKLGPADLGRPAEPGWSVTRRTLRGGRRDGVDLIELDNGALKLAIVPTRGMNLWRGMYGTDRLGWDSPIADGPVHPAHVPIGLGGGIGWLDGFDELLARCGITHNGPPYEEGGQTYPLHGRISNIPAHFVRVSVDDEAPHAITVEGHVDEARLFGPHLRMVTTVTTVPGSNRVTIRDEFRNLGDQPAEHQVLYHWNLGPPHLEEGSRLVAPIKVAVPRDARAAEGIGHHDVYGAPRPGGTEQVYFYELYGHDHGVGETVAMLRDRDGRRGVALRWNIRQLPCFTMWKNELGRRDGYVTGLEPATNYPNAKPFEKRRGRVKVIPVGGSRVSEVILEVLGTPEAVSAVEEEVRALQVHGPASIHRDPIEPYAPGVEAEEQ